MSCVVAIQENSAVYFGWDSAISNESEIRIIKNPKVFLIGDIVIGFIGNSRVGQILKYYDSWAKNNKSIETLINSMREKLEEHNCLTMEDGMDLCSSSFLIFYDKKLYEVDEFFQILELEDKYNAIGSGKYVALGCLYSNQKSKMSPIERITESLECSEKFTPFVRKPFSILEFKY